MQEFVQRSPISRIPLTLSDLREPIYIEDNKWFPVPKFEGVYEINLYGEVRSIYTGELIKVYERKLDVVILRHPNGDGSALTCNLIDIYVSSFLEVSITDMYPYVKDLKN